jgi:RNA polymerase sigma-70 factor (ECF subfamily)
MSRSPATLDDSADDAVLVARLRQRDAAAFEQLVRTEGPRMLAVAKRFLQNDDDAADAVQEAFVSVYRSIGNFAAESKLSTWLHRVVVNAALMRLRSRKRKPEVSIESLLPQFLADGHQAKSSVKWQETSQSLERRETLELVRRLIDQLPDGYREVLLVRDIDGLNTDEAANLLGLTNSAVKVRLHRARQALRTLLDPHMRGGEL